ncbi:putative helicase MOV-10 [Anopheles arabiensis]|uniref:RNA helicase n=1 Tax=Anopheles arabiensis TaxID=7173 RepID=A0A8W7LR64_ANOAR|nr:putative helicase MOV-10 [Anopheles arabiensis]
MTGEQRATTARGGKPARQSRKSKLKRTGTTRCLLQWVESAINIPESRTPQIVPKPVFRMTVEFSITQSMITIKVQNFCSQILILRSIYLYYETSKRVVLFGGVLRMVPGYEFAMEKEIHEKEDRSYHVVFLSDLLGTPYRLRETVMIHLLSPRKARGPPLKLSKLPVFPVPEYVQEVYLYGFLENPHYSRNASLWLERLKAYRAKQLNADNLTDYLRSLDQIDEFDSHLQMLRYTVENGTLEERLPKEYVLTIDQFKVPPVLLEVGSHVQVNCGVIGRNSGPTIVRGTIVERSSIILIETETPLKTLRSLKIEFPLNRLQYKLEYTALVHMSRLDFSSILFPKIESAKPKTPAKTFNDAVITEFDWFQSCIAENEQQTQAIKNIVNRTAYPAPYILFGPPGTGKTCTIVEAVLQIWKMRPKSRILVTATSNYACNELAKRLLKYVTVNDLFRYFSQTSQRDINGMDLKVVQVSNMHYGIYETPAMQDFVQTRILVCTVMTSGRLLQLGVDRSMYDYIFIDECGSCRELSALVPIGCVGTDTVNNRLQASVVLAGDPLQLGPVTRMPYLRDTPHNSSLLERLMKRPVYQKDANNNEYSPHMVTKLLDNYRSHESLFRFSNQQFYDAELRAKGDPTITHWAVNWHHLPNRKLPMLFHSVVGFMQQDSISLSYWNVQEAQLVYQYVQILMKEEINGQIVRQEDIGIVTPYSKQVEFIKNGLSTLGLDNIEVGSVDQYQGREKPVIIISAVRSNRTTVGFLADPRRLNVALTRAQALTIVIGNPENLMRNVTWYNFLKMMKQNRAITGINFNLTKRHLVPVEEGGGETMDGLDFA